MKSIIHKAIYWALPLLTLPTTGLLLRDPSLQPGAFLFRSQVY